MKYMYSDDICSKYRISTRTLYRWIDRENFPLYSKEGRSYIFVRKDVDSWFKSNRPLVGRPRI